MKYSQVCNDLAHQLHRLEVEFVITVRNDPKLEFKRRAAERLAAILATVEVNYGSEEQDIQDSVVDSDDNWGNRRTLWSSPAHIRVRPGVDDGK